jgi:hypothetical protein
MKTKTPVQSLTINTEVVLPNDTNHVGNLFGGKLMQWVDITAEGLSLSGLYRVEEVSLSFETGSYNQIVDITFNRKNPSDLASLIANQRSK